MRLKTRSIFTGIHVFKFRVFGISVVLRSVCDNDIHVITTHPGWEDLYHSKPNLNHMMVLNQQITLNGQPFNAKHNPILLTPDNADNIFSTSWTIVNNYRSDDKIVQMCRGETAVGEWITYDQLNDPDRRTVDTSPHMFFGRT